MTGQTGVPTLEQFHEDFQDADKLADMTKEAGFDEWHQLFNNKNRGCSVIACGEQPTMQRYVRIASNPQSHTLERNAYYWKVDPAGNQLPYIDGVTIHVVQDREVLVLKAIQGEFDLFGQNSALADFPVYQENKEKAGYDVYNWLVTDANQMGIQFNLTIEDPVKREIFRDKRFRIAFSHAIDRDEINEATQCGLATPMQATVHRMTPWFKEEYANAHIEYAPDMANRLLDEMGLEKRDAQGFRLMPDGRRLSVTWEYPPDTHTWGPPVVELVVDYAKDIGLEVLVKADDRAVRRAGAPEPGRDERVERGRLHHHHADRPARLGALAGHGRGGLVHAVAVLVPVRRRARRGADRRGKADPGVVGAVHHHRGHRRARPADRQRAAHARRERLRDRGDRRRDEAGAGEHQPSQRVHRGRARLRCHSLPAQPSRAVLLPRLSRSRSFRPAGRPGHPRPVPAAGSCALRISKGGRRSRGREARLAAQDNKDNSHERSGTGTMPSQAGQLHGVSRVTRSKVPPEYPERSSPRNRSHY